MQKRLVRTCLTSVERVVFEYQTFDDVKGKLWWIYFDEIWSNDSLESCLWHIEESVSYEA